MTHTHTQSLTHTLSSYYSDFSLLSIYIYIKERKEKENIDNFLGNTKDSLALLPLGALGNKHSLSSPSVGFDFLSALSYFLFMYYFRNILRNS
jgi:hypothetical protein